MENIIIIAVVAIIVISIIVYLYRAKKRGQTCIGCPYAKKCGGKCGAKKEE
ncbi:MAG: FeoB-associated Cys-rich membrane protein [Ruminococcus sp.]|nr:FeoB-associated Cys-rich membrane protein [Ruminococcus sp.]